MGGTGTSVLFDPTNGNIAYAALGNISGSASNGVFRSTDGGQTFQRLTGSGSSALPTTNVGRIEIAIAPSTPSTLYVGIQNSSNANFGSLLGIYKTTDSGNTWNNLNAPNICANVGQCWYDMTIRVHPKNPDIVFAFGSVTMARTLNGGGAWSLLNRIGPNGVEIHVDEHYLAFTNDGTKLYVANDGGMYSTTNITDAVNQVNWTELNDTLAITQFYPGVSIHPSNANISFGGAQDNGTQRYLGAVSWNDVTCGDGGFTGIDAAIPTIAYAACQNIDIRKTINSGGTWTNAVSGINQTDNVQFIPPLVIDPSNPLVLYFGTYRVWQTVNGAGTWLPASPDLSGTRATIKTIAPAPGDPNTVYTGFQIGKVFMTSNALAGSNSSWTDRSSGLPIRSVTQITVDPIDPATAYVTFSGFALGFNPTGHVFKTTNGGQNWNDISAGLADIPVNTLVVDPDIPDTLYVGTDAGVMVSTNAGATWSTLGNGLPRVVVTSLVLHRRTRTLRAGTHGRSMWDILVPLASATRQPSITSVAPVSVNAGNPAFTLSVTGTNFAAGTKLRFNGQTRSTNIVDSAHLTALITAADVAQSGRANLDAINTSPGAGVSNSVPFNIGPGSGTSIFLSLNRTSLNFGAAGAFITSAQDVTIAFNGGTGSWTAVPSSPGIIVTPNTGTGNGSIRIGINGFGASGTVTVAAGGVVNSPQAIQVNIANVAPALPFGSFDTPLNNTVGVAGAIPVTGWALDNIEVTHVDILREPVLGETQRNLIFIGTAVFSSDARPDVQAMFPAFPLNYRAGWGYQMLTNELPNASGSGPSGNGTYKLHAIAYDKVGNQQDLGTKTITVDNAHATKPFGTIDTPGQGGTASGAAFVNFGWALTPQPAMIPLDGSTITVAIDGVLMGHPTYNQFRSDIASLFPGYANSGGAVGYYYLDTTKLANGVHTISWTAFDNQGRGEGLGSRYFNVLNSGTGPAAEPEERPALTSAVTVRRGLDANRDLEVLTPADSGVYSIEMEELGRIELNAGASKGYLLVNGERRGLPVGSTLKAGVFYWQAGLGFVGEYQLLFERADGSEVRVGVRIRAQGF